MELKDKRVLVVGLGKSGVASALFLKAHGARVTVSDTKSGDELRNEIPVLLDHGITVETGGGASVSGGLDGGFIHQHNRDIVLHGVDPVALPAFQALRILPVIKRLLARGTN